MQLLLSMDQGNDQTQVGGGVTPVVPQTPSMPAMTPPPSPMPEQPVSQEPVVPQPETPKKGGSSVMKIAIWILVVALLVVVGYVVYVNYFAAPATVGLPQPTTSTTPVNPAPPLNVPAAVPLATASASPVASPTSSASAVPTATPVKTPSATP